MEHHFPTFPRYLLAVAAKVPENRADDLRSERLNLCLPADAALKPYHLIDLTKR